MSDDEFDNLQGDYADLQDVDWSSILTPPIPTSQATRNVDEREAEHALSLPRPASADASSNYSFDDMDAGFLEELNRVEERIMQSPQAGPSRLDATSGDTVLLSRRTSTIRSSSPQGALQPSRFFPSLSVEPDTPLERKLKLLLIDGAPQPVVSYLQPPENPGGLDDDRVQSSHHASLKRLRSEPSSPNAAHPHRKKGKMKANDDLGQILSTLEDEMICPICCDIFVSAHVGNPCGHSFCGDCGWQWTTKNSKNGCPVCRAALTKSMPMIPNIAMDNMVERLISALAFSGNEDWKPGGTRLKEWTSRKQQWKNDVVERAISSRQQAVKKKVVQVFDVDDFGGWLVQDDEDLDDASYEEDEGNGDLIPTSVPRFRQHARGPTRRNFRGQTR